MFTCNKYKDSLSYKPPFEGKGEGATPVFGSGFLDLRQPGEQVFIDGAGGVVVGAVTSVDVDAHRARVERLDAVCACRADPGILLYIPGQHLVNI